MSQPANCSAGTTNFVQMSRSLSCFFSIRLDFLARYWNVGDPECCTSGVDSQTPPCTSLSAEMLSGPTRFSGVRLRFSEFQKPEKIQTYYQRPKGPRPGPDTPLMHPAKRQKPWQVVKPARVLSVG